MVFEPLQEGVGIHDRTGDFAEDIRVGLHLAVEVAGQAGQAIQGAAQALRQRDQVRVGAGQGGVGTGERGIRVAQGTFELAADVGRQQPLAQPPAAGAFVPSGAATASPP